MFIIESKLMELNSCIYTSKMGGCIANVLTKKSCPSGLNSCAHIVENEGIINVFTIQLLN